MQDKRIVFINDDGGLSIVIPAPGATQQDCIAAVPPGKPYKIMLASEIPTDRTYRDAWTIDPALLTDGIGGEA